MPDHPLPTELLESPGYGLWLAANAWQRTVRAALDPLGVTQVQFAVLVAVQRLGEDGEPVTQADVCRFGSLDANMVSQVIRNLQRRGLLLRHPHPTDRRAYRLALTETGDALLQQGRAVLRPLVVSFFEPVGEDRRELARMLRTLARAADERPSPKAELESNGLH